MTSWLREAWSRRELRWLGLILILAVALRVVWVAYAARPPFGLHDPSFYFGYGLGIAAGGGYWLPAVPPIGAGYTAYYPVGYAASLAGVFSLVQHTPIPDNLVLTAAYYHIFLGICTIVFVYLIGKQLFSPAVGLVAALWLALFPNLIYHTASYLTETLFNCLLMAAILIVIWPGWEDKRLGWLRLVAFGGMIGLAALVRPIALLLVPLLPIVWLGYGFGWRRTLTHTAIALFTAAAVISPWTLRNIIVMDAPVLISTNLGDDLCIGHHPGASGTFALPDFCFAPDEYAGMTRSELEVHRNNDLTRKALKFALHNPRFELKLLSRKAYYTWEHDHDGLRAVEAYGDDPFIGSRFTLVVVPEDIPDGQVTGTAAQLAPIAQRDSSEIASAIRQAKTSGNPATPLVLARDLSGATVEDVRDSRLSGVLFVTPDSALRTALSRIADIFFYFTISVGALGLAGFVIAPRDPRRIYFLLGLLAMAGAPLPFFGDARFHVPVEPFLAVSAAWLVMFAVQNAPRLLAPRSGSVEVTDGELSVPEKDALQDA